MFRKFAFGIASALSLLLAGPFSTSANAALVDITWTGTVTSGTDFAGLFGDPLTSLSDKAYTATYRFDTSIGFSSTSVLEIVKGGTNVSATPTPAVSASLTINGVTLNIDLGREDFYQRLSQTGLSLIQMDVNATKGGGGVDVFFNTVQRTDDLYSSSLVAGLVRAFDSGDSTFGFFQRFDGSGALLANASFDPDTITIAAVVPGETPLPATWALMLSGSALVGFAASRRRRQN